MYPALDSAPAPIALLVHAAEEPRKRDFPGFLPVSVVIGGFDHDGDGGGGANRLVRPARVGEMMMPLLG